MRVVRLGKASSAVGADVQAALAAWGHGTELVGGIALIGCTPPGFLQPLEAVVVVPRGVVVVVGIDLPGPALKLQAPLQDTWKVDGWPLIRDDGLRNPALEALTAAATLTQRLQALRAEPLPVSTIIAVGPYVGQVLQPAGDLHRGVRVLHPAPTTLMAAIKELTTYERPCGAEAASQLLSKLDERAGELGTATLVEEGFSDAVSPDLASASTMLIPRFTSADLDSAAPPPQQRRDRSGRGTSWLPLMAVTVAGIALVLLITTLARSCGSDSGPAGSSGPVPVSTVDKTTR